LAAIRPPPTPPDDRLFSSLLDLLDSVTEEQFAAAIDESDARRSFAASDLG